MTSINGPLMPGHFPGKGIPVSMATPVKLPPLQKFNEVAKGMTTEEFARMYPEEYARNSNSKLMAGIKPRTAEESYAQLEKQDAVKVHTVFRSGGKIVATYSPEGGTYSSSNAAGAGTLRIMDEVAKRGLHGKAADDFISTELEKSMKNFYGRSLSVERFKSTAEAPTIGQLNFERTGIDWRLDPMINPFLYKSVDISA